MPSGRSPNLPIEAILVILISLLLAIALSGCAHTPDVLVCTEINMTRGWCTKTISDEEFFVDEAHPYAFDGEKKQSWWDVRPFMVLVPIPSWAAIKTYIVQRCKTNPQGCSEYVASWDRKISELDKKAKDE